jgi:hypothetical protein
MYMKFDMSSISYARLAIKGGVILISIHWTCDLDLDFMETCLPVYSFR